MLFLPDNDKAIESIELTSRIGSESKWIHLEKHLEWKENYEEEITSSWKDYDGIEVWHEWINGRICERTLEVIQPWWLIVMFCCENESIQEHKEDDQPVECLQKTS